MTKTQPCRWVASAALAASLVMAGPALAGWTGAGVRAGGNATGNIGPVIASDGAGGCFLAWQATSLTTIRAQHLTAAGDIAPGWPVDGVALCNGTAFVSGWPQVVSDGAGGAIVVWVDTRLGMLPFAQRVDATGHTLWTPNGIAVADSGAGSLQGFMFAAGDGSGGVFVCWDNPRVQRLDVNGARAWGGAGAVPGGAFTNPVSWNTPGLVADGAGGVILPWTETIASFQYLFLQHYDATGDPTWVSSGVQVAQVGALGGLISDDAGGAIALAQSVQRIRASGNLPWGAAGASNTNGFALIGDGAGGAIVVNTPSSPSDSSIYAERFDSTGVARWGQPRIVSGVASGFPFSIVSDGAGGAIVALMAQGDVVAQRVTSTGTVAGGWPATGRLIAGGPTDQSFPATVGDGAGGAIIAWIDADLHEIRVAHVGGDGIVPALLALVSADALVDRARLIWLSPDRSVLSATVYRAATLGSWERTGSITADGTGRLTYVDSSVRAGARYGYRLGVATPQGESTYGETWLTIPNAPTFALEGSRPDPAVGPGFRVAFSLATSAPATLRLFDISGRSIRSVALDTPQPGPQLVDLGGARTLEPGVYVIQLTQGSRSLTRKAVVLR
jgi:hypothetical protein